jgi:hypothetical protein
LLFNIAMVVRVPSDDRLARNEALFRQVNERLKDVSEVLGTADSGPEFVCECADEGCTERIRLSLGEYEWLRANPRHFVVVPGHERADIERVVEHRGRYCVVEKIGVPGEVAEDTDPRS